MHLREPAEGERCYRLCEREASAKSIVIIIIIIIIIISIITIIPLYD